MLLLYYFVYYCKNNNFDQELPPFSLELCLSNFVSHKKQDLNSVCDDSKDIEVFLHNDLSEDLNPSDETTQTTTHLQTFKERPSNHIPMDFEENFQENDCKGFIKCATQCSSPERKDNDCIIPLKKLNETGTSHTSKEVNSKMSPSDDTPIILSEIANDEANKLPRKTITVDVNMDRVRALFTHRKLRSKEGVIDSVSDGKPRIRFYAAIDPSKNKNAEHELNKEITKDMFSQVADYYLFIFEVYLSLLDHS